MNASQLTRISDAITLERARAPNYKGGDPDRNARGENFLSGKGSPSPNLGGGGYSHKQERRRGRDSIERLESEAMKDRLLKHALGALILVLMFTGWHIVYKWVH